MLLDIKLCCFKRSLCPFSSTIFLYLFLHRLAFQGKSNLFRFPNVISLAFGVYKYRVLALCLQNNKVYNAK